MTDSHRTIGPFYACRYVGVNSDPQPTNPNQDDVDVVVWLLYADPPPMDGPRETVGLLYNRRRNQPAPGMPDHRADRWIARAHRFGHHHPGQNFQGRVEDEAVKQLWLWLHRDETPPPTGRDYTTAVVHAQTFVAGASCN